MAGDTQVKEKLLKGHQVGNITYKVGSSGIRVGDLGPISAAPGRHALDVGFLVCVGPHGAGPRIRQSLQSYQLRCTCPHAPARTSHRPLL